MQWSFYLNVGLSLQAVSAVAPALVPFGCVTHHHTLCGLQQHQFIIVWFL